MVHCPECGAEVVGKAVYCHKCGERLDATEQEFPETEQGETPQMPGDVPPDPSAPEAAASPALSPTERLRETVAGRADQTLDPEDELWQGGYSSKAMIGRWALSSLVTVGLLVLGVLWLKVKYAGYIWIGIVAAILLLWIYQSLVLCFRRMNVRYRLTSQRFIHETGILRRVTDRIETIDIDDVTFEQSFLERFVGVGTIHVTSSDRSHPELLLLGIEGVKKVAGKIDDARRAERLRRGLHIEAI